MADKGKKTSRAWVVRVLLLLGSLVAGTPHAQDGDAESQFEKALMSFEVSGLSLRLNEPELAQALTANGYALRTKTQKPDQGFYRYEQRRDRKLSSAVTFRTAGETGAVTEIVVLMMNPGGATFASDETRRILGVFADPDKVCKTRPNSVRCSVFTDTNELTIQAKFKPKGAEFRLVNAPSQQARKLAEGRKRRDDAVARHEAGMRERERRDAAEQAAKEEAVEQAEAGLKKRLAELSALPPTMESLVTMNRAVTAARRQSLDENDRKLQALPSERLNEYLKELDTVRLNKAKEVVRHRMPTFQATASDMQEFDKAFRASVPALASPEIRAAWQVINRVYGEVLAERSNELYSETLKVSTAELKKLENADYSQIGTFVRIRTEVAYLQKHKSAGLAEDAKLYEDYLAAYDRSLGAVMDRSTPRLVPWIESLPPSMSALKALDRFVREAFGKWPVPERYPKLREAVLEKQRASNPENYTRPGILVSLQRGYWHEVEYRDLEDVAYVSTTLRSLKSRCPGSVPGDSDPRARAVVSMITHAVGEAMQRLQSGEMRSQAEASRAVMLGLGAIFGRPGCRVDVFGAVTQCTTEKESQELQQALMTSNAGLGDVGRLLSAGGCSSGAVKSYVNNVFEYAQRWYRSDSAAMRPKSFVMPPFPYKVAKTS